LKLFLFINFYKHKEKKRSIKNYLDFDKEMKILYNNYYLNNEEIVLKIPINNNGECDDYIEIDEFKIKNSIFICSN